LSANIHIKYNIESENQKQIKNHLIIFLFLAKKEKYRDLPLIFFFYLNIEPWKITILDIFL